MSVIQEINELSKLTKIETSLIKHLVAGRELVVTSTGLQPDKVLATIKIDSDQCLLLTRIEIESYPVYDGVKAFELHSPYYFWENAQLSWKTGDKYLTQLNTPYFLALGDCLLIFSSVPNVTLEVLTFPSNEDQEAGIVRTAYLKCRVSGFRLPISAVNELARSATTVVNSPQD